MEKWEKVKNIFIFKNNKLNININLFFFYFLNLNKIKRNGEGKFIWKNGDYYKGEWVNGI
jgi:hypothetical protein